MKTLVFAVIIFRGFNNDHVLLKLKVDISFAFVKYDGFIVLLVFLSFYFFFPSEDPLPIYT